MLPIPEKIFSVAFVQAFLLLLFRSYQPVVSTILYYVALSNVELFFDALALICRFNHDVSRQGKLLPLVVQQAFGFYEPMICFTPTKLDRARTWWNTQYNAKRHAIGRYLELRKVHL